MPREGLDESGTLNAVNEEVLIPTQGLGTVGVQITGTFVGTVQFEGTLQDVSSPTYAAVKGQPLGGGTPASSATATGIWFFSVAGLQRFRVRCSAYTSGDIEVALTASPLAASVADYAGSGGSTVDTELPAAQAVSSNLTLSDSPSVIAPSYGFDGANWDPTITHPYSADGRNTTNTGLVVMAYVHAHNGTTNDRIRTELTPYPTGTLRVVAGGYTDVVSGTLTRGANTTAYTIGDEVATAGTAPLSLNLARFNQGSGLIVGATLIYSSSPSTTPQFRLLVFDQTVTLAGDNAQFNISDADFAKCIGFIDFSTSQPGSYSGGAVQTAGASAFLGSMVNPIAFEAASASQAIFFALITLNAFTPIANSETIEVRVRCECN